MYFINRHISLKISVKYIAIILTILHLLTGNLAKSSQDRKDEVSTIIDIEQKKLSMLEKLLQVETERLSVEKDRLQVEKQKLDIMNSNAVISHFFQ